MSSWFAKFSGSLSDQLNLNMCFSPAPVFKRRGKIPNSTDFQLCERTTLWVLRLLSPQGNQNLRTFLSHQTLFRFNKTTVSIRSKHSKDGKLSRKKKNPSQKNTLLLTDLPKRKIRCLWDGLILLQCGPRRRNGADGHSAGPRDNSPAF